MIFGEVFDVNNGRSDLGKEERLDLMKLAPDLFPDLVASIDNWTKGQQASSPPIIIGVGSTLESRDYSTIGIVASLVHKRLKISHTNTIVTVKNDYSIFFQSRKLSANRFNSQPQVIGHKSTIN
jgi:hypothetical protein